MRSIQKAFKHAIAQHKAHQLQNFQCATKQGIVERGPQGTTLYTGGGNDQVKAHQNKDGSVDVSVNGEMHHFSAEEARSLTIDLGSGNDTFTASGTPCGANGFTVRGQAGNDTLNGSRGADNLDGGAGSDTINAGCGNDTVKGGSGNDRILGGGGNDTLEGGAGIDYVAGQGGNDTVTGGTFGQISFAKVGGATDQVFQGDSWKSAASSDSLSANDQNFSVNSFN